MPVGTGGSFGGATERYCRLHELLSLGFARPSKAYEFRIFEHQFGLFRPILVFTFAWASCGLDFQELVPHGHEEAARTQNAPHKTWGSDRQRSHGNLLLHSQSMEFLAVSLFMDAPRSPTWPWPRLPTLYRCPWRDWGKVWPSKTRRNESIFLVQLEEIDLGFWWLFNLLSPIPS